jgi:hypothetical protein
VLQIEKLTFSRYQRLRILLAPRCLADSVDLTNCSMYELTAYTVEKFLKIKMYLQTGEF